MMVIWEGENTFFSGNFFSIYRNKGENIGGGEKILKIWKK